jgi:hypothetical protein
VKVPKEMRNCAKYLTEAGCTCFKWIIHPTTEIQIAGRMNGQRMFNLPARRQDAVEPTIPRIQTGIVITCALLAFQPSSLRMVGLKELIEPAEKSAQKNSNVLAELAGVARM